MNIELSSSQGNQGPSLQYADYGCMAWFVMQFTLPLPLPKSGKGKLYNCTNFETAVMQPSNTVKEP